MNINLEPGKYVIAVSGGVDSVVLLDILQGLRGVKLVVAHFDHGIRLDSEEDRLFVESLARKYGWPFEYAEGYLGPKASEAEARRPRYDFLQKIQKDHAAIAIVTAHHQDDALETAIMNLLRGTGRKGLSSLGNAGALKRPMLHVSKRDILKYARSRGLDWREDSTNQEDVYLRNYIRRHILPRFSEQDRQKLADLISRSKTNNDELDSLLAGELSGRSKEGRLDKGWLKQLPHSVALEVMAAWLRQAGIRNFDSPTLERLVVSAKTGRSGQRFDVVNGNIMRVEKDNLALDTCER